MKYLLIILLGINFGLKAGGQIEPVVAVWHDYVTVTGNYYFSRAGAHYNVVVKAARYNDTLQVDFYKTSLSEGHLPDLSQDERLAIIEKLKKLVERRKQSLIDQAAYLNRF